MFPNVFFRLRVPLARMFVVLLFSLLLAGGCSLRGPGSHSRCTLEQQGYDVVALLSASSDVSLLQVEALEKTVAASGNKLRVLGLVIEKNPHLYVAWLSTTQPVFRVRRVDDFRACGKDIKAEPVLFLVDRNGRVYKVLTGYSSPQKIKDSLRKWPPE